MSDTPKFEVIDRRKRKLEEEESAAEPTPGPRLVTPAPEPPAPVAEPEPETASAPEPDAFGQSVVPTAEETDEQKAAYEASASRLEDLIRAQNPAADPQPPVTFEHLVQQLYLSAMIQMGAGTQEGQRPRVDIVGARQTIDLLGILAEKTRGNLNAEEDRMLQTVLFETRMAFLELTSMITLQPPVPPPAGKN